MRASILFILAIALGGCSINPLEHLGPVSVFLARVGEGSLFIHHTHPKPAE